MEQTAVKCQKENEGDQEKQEEKILIYEHVKTGEAFIIPDPRLKLDQLDAVQKEIYALLAKQD